MEITKYANLLGFMLHCIDKHVICVLGSNILLFDK